MKDVIVTVHGTSAGRPEDDGDRWWQRGSAFHKQLSELVTSADGSPLEFRPFHWSGRNSETDRRKAGRQLARDLRKIEEEGRPYHVIGHSHGGSVIHLALIADYVASGGWVSTAARLLVRRGRTGEVPTPHRALPNMNSLTTVGTPFVVTKRTWNIFEHFDVVGQCALVLMLANSFALVSLIYADLTDSAYVRLYSLGGNFAISFWIVLMIAVLLAATRHSRAISSRKVRSRQAKQFGARALPFRHKEDEAVSALASSLRTKPNLFTSSQFTDVVTYPIILAAGLLAVFIFIDKHDVFSIEPAFVRDLVSRYHNVCSSPAFEAHGLDCQRLSWFEYPVLAVFRISQQFSDLVRKLDGHIIETTGWGPIPYSARIFILDVIEDSAPVVVVLVCSLFARIAIPILTRPLAWSLNHISRRNLKNAIYGNDVLGERVTAIATVPPAFDERWAPLPSSVADAIEKYTEQYALETLRRSRKLLGAAAVASGPLDVSKLAGETLSWHELMHTSYFEVDEFIRLLAVGLVEAGGLKPSDAFRASSDFEEARGWLHSMRIPHDGKSASDAGGQRTRT